MSRLSRANKIVLFICLFLLGCGASPKQDCSANFSGQGLSLKVGLVSSGTYSFELCGDSRKSYPSFTVYGAATESELSQVSILNRYRLSHVQASRSGDSFEVTFPSDLYFVIFSDTNNSGVIQYDNSIELTRGALSLVPTS